MFHRVNTAVQMFCIVLFCFVFLAHFRHASSSTTALPSTPNTVSTAPSNSTGPSHTNSTSPFPATISQTSISNNTAPAQSSTIAPSIKPGKTTPKQAEKDTGRKFDGLSFFGGIILGAVICVFLLFSVKYYQAKKRSYHSL